MSRRLFSNVSGRLLALFPLFLLALIGCGSEGSPSGPDHGGNTDPPPVVVVDPDSASLTVGSVGGSVSLPDGTGVFFPAGALSSSATVVVTRGNVSTLLDGTSEAQRAIIKATSSVTEFSSDVEIRFPLPAGMTAADSMNVMSGYFDDETGSITVAPSSIQIIEGKPFLVVRTRHFSDWLAEWLFGKTPPASAGPFAIPYYNQGSSNYCWATSVHMATQAARYDDGYSVSDIVGTMGVDETGILSLQFRLSPTLSSLVRSRTGVKPIRQTWDYVNIRQMKYYLWKELGLNQRPVVLFNGTWNHAVVVVGYTDPNTFVIHDPNSTNNGAIGYTTKSWADIAGNMGMGDNMVTLAIPAAVASGDGPLRISFLNGSMEFLKPGTGPGDPSGLYRYGWDYTQSAGYSFRHSTTDVLGDPLPGPVSTFRLKGDVQLSNSHRTVAKEATAWLDINAMGAPAGTGGYSDHKAITIPANSVVNFNPAEILVDEFRYNQATTTEYALSVSAMVGGSTVDTQRLRFKIASVTPELESVNPATAVIGQSVTLYGKGFGQLAKNNEINFAGTKATKITSWADDRIVVEVPEGATSGSLVVKRGEVSSNTIPFFIQEYLTSQSFNLKWGNPGTEFEVTATIDVSGETSGAGWYTVFEERSVFHPEDWVKLYFGTTEQNPGGSQNFNINVNATATSGVHSGRITVDSYYWMVSSQTDNSLPKVEVKGNPFTITELESPYSKAAWLYINIIVSPPDGGTPKSYTMDGMGVSFHPGHRGMK